MGEVYVEDLFSLNGFDYWGDIFKVVQMSRTLGATRNLAMMLFLWLRLWVSACCFLQYFMVLYCIFSCTNFCKAQSKKFAFNKFTTTDYYFLSWFCSPSLQNVNAEHKPIAQTCFGVFKFQHFALIALHYFSSNYCVIYKSSRRGNRRTVILHDPNICSHKEILSFAIQLASVRLSGGWKCLIEIKWSMEVE